MRFVLISLTLILLNFQSFSQDRFSFDWNGKSFIDTLKSIGVDTICTIKSYCVGTVLDSENETDSVCKSEDLRYFDLFVFWKRGELDCFKKFNNCFEYYSELLDSNRFFNYFIDNQAVLLNEKVEPAFGIEINNEDTTFLLYDVDHYCEIDITIEINGKKYQNEFYDYNFDTSFNKYNGERNKRLKLFRLYSFINEEKNFITQKYRLKILK